MTYRAKRKTKNLIISFALLFALGLSAVATTYAWFAVTRLSLTETDFVSGTMGVSITSVTSYKYVYPVFQGTTLINYDSTAAEVETEDVTDYTSADESDFLSLNKLDTTKIYLNNNASSVISENDMRTEIAAQNTSLLLEVSFTSVNTEDVAFTLISNRDAADSFSYGNTTDNMSDTSLLASDFLCFNAFLDEDLSGVNVGEGEDLDDAIWEHFRTLHAGTSYANRCFFHQDENSHGTKIDVLRTELVKNPDTTPVAHKLYIFVEYEPSHVNPYFINVERLRYSYHLTNDFSFTLALSSEVAS